MKILLKDPALVDAVIKKITKKYPCFQDGFMEYGVELLKEKASESDPIVLEVDWGWNPDHALIESQIGYTQFSGISTDTEFINDKEW